MMRAPDDYTRVPKLKRGEQWRHVTAPAFVYFDAIKRRTLKIERQNLFDALGQPVRNQLGKPRKRCIPTYYGPDGQSYQNRPPWWQPVLYRLPELLKAREKAKESGERLRVFLAEGEAKVDLLRSWDLVATCSPGGANAWEPTLAAELQGCEVLSLPDNDDAGRRFVDAVGRSLVGAVLSHRVIELPGLGPSGDIVDWAKPGTGNSKEKFLKLVDAAARDWSPYFPERRKTCELVWANDVIPRARDWLWENHLLRGALELLTGIKGMGKSQMQCDIAGRVTTGRGWPDGSQGAPPGNVIMVTAEDSIDRTIVPRLIAAKADLARVIFLPRIKEDAKGRMFLLGEDLDLLEQKIRDIGEVALVTIDPITAFMGKINSHSATDVRGQLGPLKDLTERTDIACSAITHPAKNASQRAIDHFIGSQAFIAAARIGHMAVPELDTDGRPTGRTLFTLVATNEGPRLSTSLAYRQRTVLVGQDPFSGKTIDAPYVEWEKDLVAVTADQALAAVKRAENGGKEGEKSSAAIAFLSGLTANGPLPQSEIVARGEALGFSEDQLKRAKKRAGIPSFKEKGKSNGRWMWGRDPQEDLPLNEGAQEDDADCPF